MKSPIAICMRQILVLVIFFVCLSACRDKVICPAFQSTYILDDSVRSVYYSYLWKIDKEERLKYLADRKMPPPMDSSGVVLASAGDAIDYFAYVEPYTVTPDEVRKTRFGMVKYEPYWLKNYQLRTAPMENVLAPDPIEKETPVEDVGEFVASDFSDTASLVTDSTMMADVEEDTFQIPKLAQVVPPKPTTEVKYLYRFDPEDKQLNVEQAYYIKHFGKYLYTRVPIQEEPDPVADLPADSLADDGGGFFKNLFGGGNKNKVDDPVEEEPPADPPVDEVIEEDPSSGF